MKLEALAVLPINRSSLSPLSATQERQNTSPLAELQAKRLLDIKNALSSLQNRPKTRISSKSGSAEKAAWLKQRLEMLKSMLLNATPEQARALAKELKEIAHDLASLGKSLGGSAAGGGVSVSAETSGAQASEAGDSGAEEVASDAVAEAEQSAEQVENRNSSNTSLAADSDQENLSASNQESDDASLRAVLKDVQKLFKEVLAHLKAKLAAGDAEARRDLRDAEKFMSQLDHALDASSDSGVYSVGLSIGGLNVSVGAIGISGVSIDVSA